MNNSNTLKNIATGLIIALISYTTLSFIELKDESKIVTPKQDLLIELDSAASVARSN
jgi:hypothetical protein